MLGGSSSEEAVVVAVALDGGAGRLAELELAQVRVEQLLLQIAQDQSEISSAGRYANLSDFGLVPLRGLGEAVAVVELASWGAVLVPLANRLLYHPKLERSQ